jgi:hypothetical protein
MTASSLLCHCNLPRLRVATLKELHGVATGYVEDGRPHPALFKADALCLDVSRERSRGLPRG